MGERWRCCRRKDWYAAKLGFDAKVRHRCRGSRTERRYSSNRERLRDSTTIERAADVSIKPLKLLSPRAVNGTVVCAQGCTRWAKAAPDNDNYRSLPALALSVDPLRADTLPRYNA